MSPTASQAGKLTTDEAAILVHNEATNRPQPQTQMAAMNRVFKMGLGSRHEAPTSQTWQTPPRPSPREDRIAGTPAPTLAPPAP